MATAVYYFNASTTAIIDADFVWTNDANAFDSNPLTVATTTSSGDAANNYLAAGGTSAPTSGGSISGVTAQATGDAPDGGNVSANVYLADQTTLLGTALMPSGTPVSLVVPSGGWTWQKVHDLYVKLFGSGGDLYTVGIVQVTVTYDEPTASGFNIALV